ncbi:hypothetical protein HispidOSU_001230 [Sigmodon hispidus]
MGRPRGLFGAGDRGRGQGRSPLNRPPLTKEQLDAELDAHMARLDTEDRLHADMTTPDTQERPHAHLDAYKDRPDTQQLLDDDDSDVDMAEVDPKTEMDIDP